MASSGTRIKIDFRHPDAVVGDPESGCSILAGELDQDRARLCVLDHIGDQLPGSGQQQFSIDVRKVSSQSRVRNSAESWP